MNITDDVFVNIIFYLNDVRSIACLLLLHPYGIKLYLQERSIRKHLKHIIINNCGDNPSSISFDIYPFFKCRSNKESLYRFCIPYSKKLQSDFSEYSSRAWWVQYNYIHGTDLAYENTSWTIQEINSICYNDNFNITKNVKFITHYYNIIPDEYIRYLFNNYPYTIKQVGQLIDITNIILKYSDARKSVSSFIMSEEFILKYEKVLDFKHLLSTLEYIDEDFLYKFEKQIARDCDHSNLWVNVVNNCIDSNELNVENIAFKHYDEILINKDYVNVNKIPKLISMYLNT